MSQILKVRTTKQFKNRIQYGYLWLFSNEIDKKDLPKEIACVEVYDSKDNFLCTGVYNPYSLISLRVISRNKEESFNKYFFKRKIIESLNRRIQYGFDERYCRIIYGESDFLPGVVIDRYDNIIAIQFFSYAMELFMNVIIDSVVEIFSPDTIVIRNDIHQRRLEYAPEYKKIVYSKNSNKNNITTIIEHLGAKFLVDVYNGQKTGFYYDQLDNRKYIASLVRNKSVLDLCCYTGGFSIISSLNGASNVTGVDSSSTAIHLAKENAKLNKTKVEFIEADVEDFVSNSKKKYDLIIFDPPSYVRTNQDVKNAEKKYYSMCNKIIKLLNSEGIFAFSVCSRFISQQKIEQIIQSCLLKNKLKGFILYRGIQSLDHPVYLPMKQETEYLKFIVVQVYKS
ncbi:MAG: class I SAM-dependent rRNA methyltransferase [Endomicrobia bacterium]|nr:class I SAM-dependent rRNA methyltransferase [Endomicrobiia bacterium]